ncbi:MAG: AI-2E family transporter [Kofleriaceae bacterium]
MITKLPVWLLAGLVIAGGLVLAPLVPWMVMALWLGLYARRIHAPLTRKLGGRDKLAATLTVSLLLVVVLPIAVVVTSIVFDAIALVQRLLASDQAQVVFVKLVESNGTPQDGDARQAIDTASSMIDLVLAQGDRAWAILQDLAGAAARIVIGLLVMVTGMYGVLVEGHGWYAWIEQHTTIRADHLRRFGDAFVETGRGLWWGIVGAGMMQALVATVAYLVIGVPSALALGLLTLLFSVIPAVGTALVWAPVAAGLALTGRPVAALILAGIGVVVIGSVDNLARPWLARRGELQLPTWILLVAMFGGVEILGPWGLVLGPLAVRLAKEAMMLARESREAAVPS